MSALKEEHSGKLTLLWKRSESSNHNIASSRLLHLLVSVEREIKICSPLLLLLSSSPAAAQR